MSKLNVIPDRDRGSRNDVEVTINESATRSRMGPRREGGFLVVRIAEPSSPK